MTVGCRVGSAPSHVHEFAAKALVVQGEMWLTHVRPLQSQT
jgi:hypothetical protein